MATNREHQVVLLAILAMALSFADPGMAQVLRGRDRDRQPPAEEQDTDRDRDRDRDDDADRGQNRDEGRAAPRLRDRADEEGHEEGVPEEPASDGEGRHRIAIARWRLGVHAYNTEAGVVITRVARGTPAAGQGLEPGDRIVTVDGYQVGYVNNRMYTLGEELQRRADRSGEVALLVQNVRDRTLVVLEVELERR